MYHLEQTCASLRAQIAATELDLARLKQDLRDAEKAAATAKVQNGMNGEASDKHNSKRSWPLLAEEYRRYGRQMIVPQLGLEGQLMPDISVVPVC